ncbi:putative G-patch domain protein [Penicillium brasilianum]|uniref:Putative G-patch domain protein n=1 Tax=Penicillium brasilianum TaxID=104259 RepID=A0A1S9RHQ8_PENBI|nr:putative G-patch domain protein [Penicillium brasilianum]
MSDEEEDYMSMVIEEPTQKETFTQRKRREQREAEARGRVPSKAERAAQEAARRDEALAKSTLDPSNKGFQMMAKLGFRPGESLGKRDPPGPATASTTTTTESDPSSTHRPVSARAEPLNLIFKEGRGGIGLDSEKKRKIREEAAEATKKIKQDEGDYRDRVREERESRRAEAHVRAAQKVAERLDAEAENEAQSTSPAGAGEQSEPQSRENDTSESQTRSNAGDDSHSDDDDIPGRTNSQDESRKAGATRRKHYKPTAQLNVLYRGLVREREERERSIQARHALQTSLPSSFFPRAKLPGYTDVTLDGDDQQALGTREPYTAIVEQEVEEEDPELDAFNALEPAERLQRLVMYLRETYRYCFWCKYRYETDDELEGCPGLTEEDHD